MDQRADDKNALGEPTHEVFNQSPPLVNYNLYTSDPVLRRAVKTGHGDFATDALMRVGAELGTPENFEWARQANQFGPTLKTFDPTGHRVDRIEFHPSWHQLMEGVIGRGLHAGPWAIPREGAHVARAAAYFMQTQIESGTLCPTTMTYGSMPALAKDAELARDWLPVLLSVRYDARDLPIAQKSGGLIGMGMTEKQGGSDVRANTTVASPDGAGAHRLTGHKWFFSAPQCDAHLVLAQAAEGLSCFFVPRFTPDGQKNPIHIQRLKDKLGNRSNASAEVEFRGTWGKLLGEPGRGIPTILEMGTYTRLDCVTGTAGLMRQMVTQALHHARHRHVFGLPLIEQPLMQQVLCDLCLESAAATALAMRLAHAFDAPSSDEGEMALRRVVTPAAKFWVCKRGPELAAEAIEVLGGNGYVEELPLARIYREMPVNSIWEGSGNVMCLDVLRGLTRMPRAREAIAAQLHEAVGRDEKFDRAFEVFATDLSRASWPENQARHLSWQLVVMLQASLLLLDGDPALAQGFCQTRLASARGAVFGSSSAQLAFAPIFAASWEDI